MKLWVGGEVHSELIDRYRTARIKVVKAINQAIASTEYDIPLGAWDCIAILRNDDEFAEIVKYSRNKKEMEFRLKIDYQAFLIGSDAQRECLIFQMLKRSLDLLKEEGITGIEKLEADVTRVGKSNNWL